MTITVKELNCRFPLADTDVLEVVIDIAKEQDIQYFVYSELKKRRLKANKATEIAISYYLFYEIIQPKYLAQTFEKTNHWRTKEERLKLAIFKKLTDEQKWNYVSKGILDCASIVSCYINNYKDSIEDFDNFEEMTIEQLYTRGIIYELERLHNEELAGIDL